MGGWGRVGRAVAHRRRRDIRGRGLPGRVARLATRRRCATRTSPCCTPARSCSSPAPATTEDDFNAGTFTTSLWDPTTDTFQSVATPWDAFCAGHAFLPDGELLVAGGNTAYPGPKTNNANAGSSKAYVFNPATSTLRGAAEHGGRPLVPDRRRARQRQPLHRRRPGRDRAPHQHQPDLQRHHAGRHQGATVGAVVHADVPGAPPAEGRSPLLLRRERLRPGPGAAGHLELHDERVDGGPGTHLGRTVATRG